MGEIYLCRGDVRSRVRQVLRVIRRLPSARGEVEGRSATGALPRLRVPRGEVPAARPDPEARRRHARRQPALGQGRGRSTPPRATRPGPTTSAALLGWCEEVGVEVVTLWLLSSDNLTNRPPEEITGLLAIIEGAVESLAEAGRWRIHPVGALDLLPPETAARLKAAEESTRHIDGMLVNVAVGYGGRREIADAIRALLADHAAQGPSLEELAEADRCRAHRRAPLHQGTARPRPGDPHVGRAAARSGFLLWQSANSEFYFCEALWPDFRRVDFLRAIRAYAARERRFGG